MASFFSSNPTILASAQTVAGSALTFLGGVQKASAYRAGGAASMATARYNASLVKAQEIEDVNDLARRTASFISTQRAQSGKSGFDPGSRSHLDLLNDTMTTFEREAIDVRNKSKQQQASVIYEGKVQSFLAEQKASQAMFSGISSAFQSITSLF